MDMDKRHSISKPSIHLQSDVAGDITGQHQILQTAGGSFIVDLRKQALIVVGIVPVPNK